eukprot:Phypoly_transcript_12845.p1 GENE.Phypoly_transcript_12845~~Phypoly_transcript_12845.p1  ORF type:complete len:100 (-),score=1.44 Phypoly_transcript_12845:778-1077(-)
MLTRLIVCGIILSISFLAIMGPILLLTIDWLPALLFIAYFFIFVTMLVFISAAYTMHKNSIWTSSAGMAILAAEVVNVLIVFVLFQVVGLNDGIKPFTK